MGPGNHWRCVLRLALIGLGSLSLGTAAGADAVDPATFGEPIARFIITGNARTQEKYLQKWTALGPARILTREALDAARQELLDRGLFREIRFASERDAGGDVVLRLELVEKRYALLLPRASRNNDGDVKAGFRLRMNNLNGADQSLQALLQQEKQSDGDDAEEFELEYSLELFDRPYELEFELERIIENTEVDDFDNVETTNQFEFEVARDWHVDGWSIPVTLSTGIVLEEVELDRPYPESLDAIEAGRFNRVEIGFRLDNVHRDRFRRFGSLYRLSFERGFDWLGSDFTSNIVTFELRGFRPINAYDSFEYRLIFAASNDSPFGRLRFGLGGGSTVRGLEDFDDRGDARIFTNIEYVFAYRKRPHLRHTLFVDVGNVWDDLESIRLSDWEYTVGTGFRWKIDAFVKTDLFLDYGYDVENSEGKLYGGTSLNF